MNAAGSWVIQRTAPGEPVTYWGARDRWIHRRTIKHLVDRVPECANRYTSYDVAFDIAEWLRTHQPLAHGEVIAVVSEPERMPA